MTDIDLFKIIDSDTDISIRKEMAIKLMEGYLHLGDLNNVDDFISKIELDSSLIKLSDRELQLFLLKVSLLSKTNPMFRFKHIEHLFKMVNLQNFNETARSFLNKLNLTSHHKHIYSIRTNSIKISHENEETELPGWVDFNDSCIGLTTWNKKTEIYTEIRYSSIQDWFFKGNQVLVAILPKISVQIDIGNNYSRVLPFIFEHLKSKKYQKRSEPSSIIELNSISVKKSSSPLLKDHRKRVSMSASLANWAKRESTDQFLPDKKCIKKLISLKLKKWFQKACSKHVYCVRYGINGFELLDTYDSPLLEFPESSSKFLQSMK